EVLPYGVHLLDDGEGTFFSSAFDPATLKLGAEAFGPAGVLEGCYAVSEVASMTTGEKIGNIGSITLERTGEETGAAAPLSGRPKKVTVALTEMKTAAADETMAASSVAGVAGSFAPAAASASVLGIVPASSQKGTVKIVTSAGSPLDRKDAAEVIGLLLDTASESGHKAVRIDGKTPEELASGNGEESSEETEEETESEEESESRTGDSEENDSEDASEKETKKSEKQTKEDSEGKAGEDSEEDTEEKTKADDSRRALKRTKPTKEEEDSSENKSEDSNKNKSEDSNKNKSEDSTKEKSTKEDSTKEDSAKDGKDQDDKNKEDKTKEDKNKDDKTKDDKTKEDKGKKQNISPIPSGLTAEKHRENLKTLGWSQTITGGEYKSGVRYRAVSEGSASLLPLKVVIYVDETDQDALATAGLFDPVKLLEEQGISVRICKVSPERYAGITGTEIQ
ncbi:MAG: hypothetical protein J5825_05665, partial [Lachnospiraceae bacterium]|nr:hypothetical protein [Lachnospiraceae bacterium]